MGSNPTSRIMNTLIAVAIEEEVPTLKHEHNVFAVGVGKVNATHALTRLIIEHEPKLVVNYGTAGGVTRYLKGLIECSHFIQWDMNCTKVGFSKFQTPFEPPAWTVIGSGDGVIDSALRSPEVDPETGAVLYIDNRKPVSRALAQNEDIKVVVQF